MRSHNEERQDSTNTGVCEAAVRALQRNKKKRNRSKGRDRLRSVETEQNVLEAARDRLAIAFNDFDRVLVAFSCGKDSGVLLNLAYQYAAEHSLKHKLAFYYEDYEAGYRFTHEYAQRTFESLSDVDRYWLCLPISAACSVSMHQTRWIPWHPKEQDIWVRPMPTLPCVVNLENCQFPFKIGAKGFYVRIEFAKWFAKKHGRTAVLIGLRADESMTRRAIFTSQHRAEMHKGLKYTKTVDKLTTNFYPLFDWKTEDIWVANARFGFDYNKVYDLYYQAGMSIGQMRIASPFHQSGQDNLKLFRVIDPNSWGRMVGRVNGVNFTGIYGGTTAMGWKNITKPAHFTWKQYAEFLINTLPDAAKKKLLDSIARLSKSWEEDGYGRNPRVIAAMLEEGIELENTHVIAKNCTKPDVYEIVKIKSGFPDDTKVHNLFRICPSWKGVCITIMKNDFGCLYMGCQRTKDQNKLKRDALKKFADRK